MYRYDFFVKIILLCGICLFFSNCNSLVNVPHNSNLQQQAIDERLQGFNIGELQYACDGCDFYMQEAIISKGTNMNEGSIGGSRSQTGVRVYIFHNVSIEQAFYMLLDSNIFAHSMDKNIKNSLMSSILSKKNDFSEHNSVDEIGLYAFSSISYAKRLDNKDIYPKAMLDSIEIVQKQGESINSTNSLEAFIVDRTIVILHFYGENNTWTRH